MEYIKTNKRRSRRKKYGILFGSVLILLALGIAGYAGVKQNEISRANQALAQLNDEVDKAQAAVRAKKEAPVYISLPGAAPIKAIVEDYNAPSSLWTYVNKQRAVPLSYAPELVVPGVSTRVDKGIEEQSVRVDVARPLEELFAAARKEGHDLMVGSGYRSAKLQATYFNSYAASSGIEMAKQYSAEPGHSEHQLGLAVDISSTSRACYLSECFTSSADGTWLAKHAHEYGFHLHYQKGKEAITGYNFEPWHYRYVGIDLATALYQSNQTLDEAWPQLQTALATLKQNGAVPNTQ